jgi:nucleoside-diphosphate-sugar epimerase
MNILVTGSKGFVASHLIPKLKDSGHEVIGMDIKANYDCEDYGDCLELIKDIDVVIHLAAYIDVQESIRKPAIYFANNLGGLVNMLNGSLGNKVKRFIFASSAAADLPQSPYGATKLCGEIWCDIFQKCYGLSTISLRFFNVYGNGTEKGVIPTWIKAVKEGRGIKVNGGKQIRDFIYVDDIVDAIIHAIAIKDRGVYEVGTGKGTQLWGDLVPTLERVMGKEFSWTVDKQPENEIGISTAYTTEESMDYRETGWKPKYTLEQGLKEMLSD